MSCPICNHPKRQEIDQALLAESATLNALSQEYGLSLSAINRHQAHLQGKVGRARDQLKNNLFQSCYFWLIRALEMTMQTAETAQAEGNQKLMLQSLAQGSRFITLIQKQDLPLEDRLVYDILTSPEFVTQTSLLPHDPNLMTMARQSQAAIFAAPCPEGTLTFSEEFKPAAQPAAQGSPSKRQPKKTKAEPETADDSSKWEMGEDGYERYVYDDEEAYRLQETEKLIANFDFEALGRGLSPAEENAKMNAIIDLIYKSIPIPTDKPLSEYLDEMRGQTEPGAA